MPNYKNLFIAFVFAIAIGQVLEYFEIRAAVGGFLALLGLIGLTFVYLVKGD